MFLFSIVLLSICLLPSPWAFAGENTAAKALINEKSAAKAIKTSSQKERPPKTDLKKTEKETGKIFPSVAAQLADAKKRLAQKEAALLQKKNRKNQNSTKTAGTTNKAGFQDDPTLAPPPPDDRLTSIIGPFFKSMFMLIVVLGIAWLTLHKGLGKLMVRAQAGKRMQVIEKTSLDQRRSLYLVSVDGREFILGGGEGGVVFLSDVKTDPPASFSESLKGDTEMKTLSKAPISQPLKIHSKTHAKLESTDNDDMKNTNYSSGVST